MQASSYTLPLILKNRFPFLKMISSLATALLEDEFKDTIISSNDKAELTRYILKMMEEEN